MTNDSVKCICFSIFSFHFIFHEFNVKMFVTISFCFVFAAVSFLRYNKILIIIIVLLECFVLFMLRS